MPGSVVRLIADALPNQECPGLSHDDQLEFVLVVRNCWRIDRGDRSGFVSPGMLWRIAR